MILGDNLGAHPTSDKRPQQRGHLRSNSESEVYRAARLDWTTCDVAISAGSNQAAFL